MAVTHDMIAVKLGINRTTVTKALKGDPSIKSATRQKVKETATLMGYDFKQSQKENRREGKRYYVHEDITFTLYNEDHKAIRGNGVLLNLSSNGALMRLKSVEGNVMPAMPFQIRVTFTDPEVRPHELPPGRVLRTVFYSHSECGFKFIDNERIQPEFLEALEKRSFDRLDNR